MDSSATPSTVLEEKEEVEEDDEHDLPISADELRTLGNQHFAAGDFDTALPIYSLAIDAARKEDDDAVAAVENDSSRVKQTTDGTDDDRDPQEQSPSPQPSVVVHLCNRSACLYRMERYEEARNDAKEAVMISGGRNAKASFRLARTQLALMDYDAAVTTLENAIAKMQEEKTTNDDDKTTNKSEEELETQINELTKLLAFAKRKKQASSNKNTSPTTPQAEQPLIIKCLKTEPRKPSIREFDRGPELGVGNFSRIIIVTHKTTHEQFALKIIEKKKAESLAKRQHPNVYNEIQMERRVLTERLPRHSNIVIMYHAFQDYTSLYFLMDLHLECGDLWSTMRYENRMVGTYPSLAKRYLWELIDALEHCHCHGIVHRDVKPENVLLSNTGHVILIDFGTAKDLIQTDLNGPEFVGTPDFMSPEAVKGTSGSDEVNAEKEKYNVKGGNHCIDLWALGAVAFQLHTGQTPFASPSQYLAFLKIQRGNLYRPWGIVMDELWDLIGTLMRVEPRERLGADCFGIEVEKKEDEKGEGKDDEVKRRVVKKEGGYDVLRNHPYFHPLNKERVQCSETAVAGSDSNGASGESKDDGNNHQLHLVTELSTTPIPTLHDLCIRSLTSLIRTDSLNLDCDTLHPPGDNSSHDMLRLNPTDRNAVLHILDRLQLLSEPRIYRRFFHKKQEGRLNRVRVGTRDYVGLTQLNDNQGQFPTSGDEDNEQQSSSTQRQQQPIRFVHITNPLFLQQINLSCSDEQRKVYITQLKDSIRAINKTRPKVVIASGYIDDQCRKLLAKINETIPVILNDGTEYYSFWCCGAQGLVLRSTDFMNKNDDDDDDEKNDGKEDDGGKSRVEKREMGQMRWLREQLEQSRMARHHTFAFVDCDPRTLPHGLVKKLARGKTLCTMGIMSSSSGSSDDDDGEEKTSFQMEYRYEVDKKVSPAAVGPVVAAASAKPPHGTNGGDDGDDNHDDDVLSVESVDSEEDETDSHTMQIVGRKDSGLRYVTLEDHGVWESEIV